MLCEIRGIIFVYIVQIMGVQGYIKVSHHITVYGGKFFKVHFDMANVNKFNQNLMKFMYVTQMLSRILCLENSCTLLKLGVYRDTKE